MKTKQSKKHVGVVYVDTNGKQEFKPEKPTLEQMQQWVGGYIERTTCQWQGKLCDMVVNEEGHLKRLPLNAVATKAYWGACRPGTTHTIVGNAIIFVGCKLS